MLYKMGLNTKLHVTVSVYKLKVKTNEAKGMAQTQIQRTCTPLGYIYIYFIFIEFLSLMQNVSTESINFIKRVPIKLTT